MGKNATVYSDFFAPNNPSTQQQQKGHQIDPATVAVAPGTVATEPAKTRPHPTAAEVFENFKGKDLAYYDSQVRVANRTSQEIKMYKDIMKDLWIDGGFQIRWLRDNGDLPLLNQAYWHYTYCQADISQILYKLRSSSHREYDRKEIGNKA
ncbi:hypothetical protein BGZ95_001278 [Linnemannia exigua]|uniref:Uncharacterized protein n=1 Tax=Linnemannia exigua TaxID=604196 RepID=A0AAD4H523_9FUNG|nr:hypothetical protein BGZ95_001278 [Linnemannia exigua]